MQRGGGPALHACDTAVHQYESLASEASAASAGIVQGSQLEMQPMGVDGTVGLVGSAGPEGAPVFPPSCDGEGFAACGIPTVLDFLSSKEWGRVRQAASRMHGAEALDASRRAVQECAAPALSGRREKRKKKQREFPAPRATAASGAGAQGVRRAWAWVAAWALHLWHCFFGLVGSTGSAGAARAIHLWH